MGERGGQKQEGEWLPGCRVGAALGEGAGKGEGERVSKSHLSHGDERWQHGKLSVTRPGTSGTFAAWLQKTGGSLVTQPPGGGSMGRVRVIFFVAY